MRKRGAAPPPVKNAPRTKKVVSAARQVAQTGWPKLKGSGRFVNKCDERIERDWHGMKIKFTIFRRQVERCKKRPPRLASCPRWQLIFLGQQGHGMRWLPNSFWIMHLRRDVIRRTPNRPNCCYIICVPSSHCNNWIILCREEIEKEPPCAFPDTRNPVNSNLVYKMTAAPADTETINCACTEPNIKLY